MDFDRVARAAEEAATASEPDGAKRVMIVYVAPGDGGIWVHRPGCGTHQLGGAETEGEFSTMLHSAIVKLWPESKPKTRRWLRLAADFMARSPIGRRLAGGSSDDDD